MTEEKLNKRNCKISSPQEISDACLKHDGVSLTHIVGPNNWLIAN